MAETKKEKDAQKIDYYLGVRSPFRQYQRGDQIKDYEEIVKILNSAEKFSVVRIKIK